MLKKLATSAVALVIGLIAFLWGAGAASAHVTVNSTSAVQGGYAVLAFRVPTESATASTTKLTVQLPAEAPFTSVSVEVKAGWSYVVTKAKLPTPAKTDDGDTITDYVSTIAWTADANSAIKPGEFAEFRVSVGPLPKTNTVVFKAIQHYSDGSDVNWIDQAAPGSNAELAHPAPTLKLAAATTTSTESAEDDGDGTGWVAVTGLVLAIVAVIAALAALVIVIRRPARTE
jgi:uncharacterized protein YcnI